MKKTSLLKVVSLVMFCLLGIYQTGYTWPGVERNGVSICTVSSDKGTPRLVHHQNATFISWIDRRSDNADIYIQDIDSTGSLKWTANGVPICTASSYQFGHQMMSIGQGRVLITWYDNRDGGSNWYVYIQAVDSSGSMMWATNGLRICTTSNSQSSPQIASDGQGGAIITWVDQRSGQDDIYAQAIDSTGALKWNPNGVAICTAPDNQYQQQITMDGFGGAIITWEDWRAGSDYNIYAQAVDSSGTVKWTNNGVAICTDTTGQWSPQLVMDGRGGAIITWRGSRNGVMDIYAQAVDSSGLVKWTTNGISISTCTFNDPRIISDGKCGAFIGWYTNDIYVQAIDSTGTIKWTEYGVAVCTASDIQQESQWIIDNQGGVIVVFEDFRSGTDYDIYAQAISSTGALKWASSGVPVCKSAGDQRSPQIVPDGKAGAVIAWADRRSGTNYNIYAQGIDSFGSVGPLVTRLTDLKLFKDESLYTAFNMPDQFAAETVDNFTIVENFLDLCSIIGNNVSQDDYALATTGINSFFVSGSFGITTSESAVKYSSYKLMKLPYIGIIPGTYQDFPIYQYAYNSAGIMIPESFGRTDALSVSDTTKISAAWLNSSTIRITATASFVTSGFIDIIASPAISKPFGVDIDRERLFVFPSLVTTAGFAYANDTQNFVYQNAMDRTVLAAISHVTTMADRNELSADGVMRITFSNESSGVKATLVSTQWKNYKTAQWYTVRMRVFSPDTGNQHQALLYQYDNPVATGNHIDIGAYVCFGIPTVWTWVEQSLYCQQSGSGYPQLILKAGSAGTVYVDEIQLINTSPAILSNLRLPANLKYAYGQFSTANETTGWGYQSLAGDSGATIIPPFNVSDGVLGFDFRDNGSGTKLMGLKATATNAIPGKIYTPENLPNAEIGMKLDFLKYMGQATTANSLIAMYMFGVQTSGQFTIGTPSSELIATGEFGSLKNGTHWVIGKSICRFHQFQYMLKNDLSSILTLDNIEMFQDRDSNKYGDFSLYP